MTYSFLVHCQASAKIVAAAGANVSIADISEPNLAKAKTELEALGAKVLTFVVNVADGKQVEEWLKNTNETFGKVDGAVNAAGVDPGSGKLIHELEDKG